MSRYVEPAFPKRIRSHAWVLGGSSWGLCGRRRSVPRSNQSFASRVPKDSGACKHVLTPRTGFGRLTASDPGRRKPALAPVVAVIKGCSECLLSARDHSVPSVSCRGTWRGTHHLGTISPRRVAGAFTKRTPARTSSESPAAGVSGPSATPQTCPSSKRRPTRSGAHPRSMATMLSLGGSRARLPQTGRRTGSRC